MQIIQSIIDNDLYKITMQNLVLHLYPDAEVDYKFNNRNKSMKFNKEFLDAFSYALVLMEELSLSPREEVFLREKCPYLPESYLHYLRNYRFNANEVRCNLTPDGDLDITIRGKWHSTILWEVPLMAIISELYFIHCDKDWILDNQLELARGKASILFNNNCIFADFGTRRRRSYVSQETVVYALKDAPTFVGTSNVHLAKQFNVKPIGTMAHEFIMGVSALEGLRNANRFSLEIWNKFYKGNLAVALTDTFGTDAFFKDFNLELARIYDVRHDSGEPCEFADKVIKKYKSLGLDPTTKNIVFSDGLDVKEAVRIAKHCEGKIKCSFGIGTHLTNDYMKADGSKSKALNMVIKLHSVNGIPVVKISDSATKAIGDKNALRVAMWTFFNHPLDV